MLVSFSCSVSSALRASATTTSSRRPPAALWHHVLSDSNQSAALPRPLSIQFSNSARTEASFVLNLSLTCWSWRVFQCIRTTGDEHDLFFLRQLFVLLAKHFGFTQLWNMQAVNCKVKSTCCCHLSVFMYLSYLRLMWYCGTGSTFKCVLFKGSFLFFFNSKIKIK